jgi:predicted aspartyl protease
MTTKIPIEIISVGNDGHHIIIKGKINKKDRFLMIDTGASKSVFNVSLLNIKTKEGMSVYQKNASAVTMTLDEIPSTNGIIKELQIQDLKIYNFEATLIDLKHINDLYQNNSGKEISGLIGNDLLIKYKAVIDYSNKVLILSY